MKQKLLKKISTYIIFSISLFSCTPPDNIKQPETNTKFIDTFYNLDKDSINKLDPIIPNNKITLNKPEDLNSANIIKEIEDINNDKLNSDKENRIVYWLDDVGKWQDISNNLAVKYKIESVKSTLMSNTLKTAHNDTLVNVFQNKYLYNRKFRASKVPSYPSEKSAIAQVSSDILIHFYPEEKDYLTRLSAENKEVAFWGKEHLKSDIVAGEEVGKFIALNVISNLKLTDK